MYSAMADIASQTNDGELLQACERIWDDIVRHKMYITGGIGSAGFSERFTINGDLPNFEAYSETCASIALLFFAHRMFNISKDGQYTDVIEKALYNTIYGSVGVNGKSFFYANPLAEYPEKRDYEFKYQGKKYSCSTRQPWYDTSCCPSNIARLLASLGSYIYSASDEEIYVNLYISSNFESNINSTPVLLGQTTSYTSDGKVLFNVKTLDFFDGTIAFRMPYWSSRTSLKINGRPVDLADICSKGYAKINRRWRDNDKIEIEFDMSIRRVRANSIVMQNAGCFAIQRGPLVYCIESVDNGDCLSDIFVEKDAKFSVGGDIDNSGVKFISFDAKRRVRSGDSLYSFDDVKADSFKALAVPYFFRANRARSEMIVWIRENI